jgi:DNA-directed RNA polymerase subunit F
MHYGYEQVIGGVGRFVDKTFNTLTAIGTGKKPEARDVPVVSRFYKSIPEEQAGAGANEFELIAKVLEEQSRERFYLSQQAEDSYQQLKNLPKEDAAALFDEIKEADPALAKKIADVKKEDDRGLSFIDRKILQLGVGNGERAKFLKAKFDELETDEEKAQLWTEYRAKGIISDNVSKQLKELLKEED